MADLTELPANELVATDYFQSKFWKVFHESEATGNINPGVDNIVSLKAHRQYIHVYMKLSSCHVLSSHCHVTVFLLVRLSRA
jgi:hypothetical protein